MQWKKNQLDRTTALQAIQAQYNAQLDALRYHLGKAVSVSNARADRIAEEFLKKLDSEHIQILKELGLRNAETRATALIEVREMIFIKLKELETKKWPQPLVDRTIRDLFDLEKRVCAEMMKELGA
jgi:F0F1-type ATP synthase membrane subunit b/b'